MSTNREAADELLATTIVHNEMLRALWAHVLTETGSDPLDTADACRSLTLNAMEGAFDNSDDPVTESLRQTAVTKMEELWEDIIEEVQVIVGPVAAVPTAYGQRVVEQMQKRDGATPPDGMQDR